jgi:hypothetical protein
MLCVMLPYVCPGVAQGAPYQYLPADTALPAGVALASPQEDGTALGSFATI